MRKGLAMTERVKQEYAVIQDLTPLLALGVLYFSLTVSRRACIRARIKLGVEARRAVAFTWYSGHRTASLGQDGEPSAAALVSSQSQRDREYKGRNLNETRSREQRIPSR